MIECKWCQIKRQVEYVQSYPETVAEKMEKNFQKVEKRHENFVFVPKKEQSDLYFDYCVVSKSTVY